MAKRIDPLNAEQLRRVMQTIASRADVARTLLIYAGTDTDELGRAVEASIALLTNIGAMADENADYPVLGDAAEWQFGSTFAYLGKEGVMGSTVYSAVRGSEVKNG
ncbi:hypothetical protein APR48_42035 [Variovorax paradoxus]|jgi:Tfp pilus assembly PilM family ATPase|uniref:hypothetical protein n=1 Tax=Variovorax paradoxus TaxID=34073 RepID=UPI0006E5F4C3|nr:hypothetical protein APR52_36680 [Variovorax paradoxus]KPV17371.1 hypothetical protein APR48_42035 [Variovorax paradoxus]KPV18544.1 hypothetical protein APR51_23095 [Variovorax paradoxus]